MQSNSHGREGELAFCSWREGCRRTCGHILKSLQVLRLPQSKVLGEGELLSRGLPPPVPILRLDSGAHTGECAVLLSFQETAGCWPPLAPSPRTPNCCPVWCPRGRASRRTMLASSIFRWRTIRKPELIYVWGVCMCVWRLCERQLVHALKLTFPLFFWKKKNDIYQGRFLPNY